MSREPAARPVPEPVGEYKRILQSVLDARPSGTRQRLAEKLDKNRSFISQIANPAYAVPIPAQHLDAIFAVCHFSPDQRAAFLAAYARAHPGRHEVVRAPRPVRRLVLQVPDLGSAARNRRVDELFAELARRIAGLAIRDK